jgi:hypothetical protein
MSNTAILDSCKVAWNDFVDTYLDHISEEYGNYYVRWKGYECFLTDNDSNPTPNAEICKLLSEHAENYGFILEGDKFVLNESMRLKASQE